MKSWKGLKESRKNSTSGEIQSTISITSASTLADELQLLFLVTYLKSGIGLDVVKAFKAFTT